MMITDVNFRGFKNAGMQVNQICNEAGELKMLLTILNTELTNDYAGKELDTFYSILRKTPNKTNKKFLNLQFWQYLQLDDRVKYDDKFVINDVEYSVNMENLGVFEKLVKLFKKIKETPEYLFCVNKDYVTSSDCIDSFILPPDCVDKERLAVIHDPENVKSVCEYLSKEITEAVSYLLEC